jgi:hypothetical protein
VTGAVLYTGRFVLAFYVSWAVLGWKVDCKRCNSCDTGCDTGGLRVLSGGGGVSLPTANEVTGVDGLLGRLGDLMG